jgi:hypothetical protein
VALQLPLAKMARNRGREMMTRALIAVAVTFALVLPISAVAQQSAPPDRSNRSGEVRGKGRAEQVRGANSEKRDARSSAKEEGKGAKERGAGKK